MTSRRIGIIGAGPGGICAAIEFRRLGLGAVTIFEKAAGVGGVWWHNTYPGAACDVPSYLYSFSFEPKNDWSKPYANQPEIQAYVEHCVKKYDLESCLRLETPITSARWNEDRATWLLTTDAGDQHEFDVVVGAVGMFGAPAYPDIAGLDDFAGHTFHSARWDHDHDLSGRRVGVIGSAASAVQFIPEIAQVVGRLTVFQRSPNWVMPKEDTPYTPEQLEAYANDDAVRAERQAIYDRLDLALTFSIKQINAYCERLAFENLALVDDAELRAKLTPHYPYGCKRPLLSNEYYPTFNRPNVDVVTESIARVTAAGIETVDRVERPFDTIVLATGFDTLHYISSVDVTGRDGRRLTDVWSDGAQAYLGITTAGFPNVFQLYGPNTNNGSILFMLECQVDYIARKLQYMDEQATRWIDIRPEVQDEYNVALQHDLDNVEVWQANCNNYYRVPSGRIITQWPHSMTEYRTRTTRDDTNAYVSSP